MLRIIEDYREGIETNDTYQSLSFSGPFVIFLDQNLEWRLTHSSYLKGMAVKLGITETNEQQRNKLLAILQKRIPASIDANLYMIIKSAGNKRSYQYMFFTGINNPRCLKDILRKLRIIGYLK